MKALKNGREGSRWQGEHEWEELKAIVERKENGLVGALLEHACI